MIEIAWILVVVGGILLLVAFAEAKDDAHRDWQRPAKWGLLLGGLGLVVFMFDAAVT